MKKILLAGGAAIIVLIFLILFSLDYFDTTQEESVDKAAIKSKLMELREMQEREAEILTSYAVIDSVKGIYRIPVEEAMKILVNEAGKQHK